MKKRTLLLGAAIAAGTASVAASRRLVSRWAKNPDPLGGKPAAFPGGEQRFIELPDGARISTVTIGSGPTIVCVHGLTASRNDWGPMAPALLDAGFRLIAVEQRGHGDSTSGSAGYGSAQLGQDLSIVLQQLDIHAAALMGHSMGGMAAMAYAVDDPEQFNERVDRLILIGTAASLVIPGSAVGFKLSGIAIPDWLKPSNRRLRVGAGLSVFGKNPSLNMVDQAVESASKLPEDVRALATSALGAHNVLDRVGQISKPTLVIGGTRDLLIRPSQVRELAESIPNAELHMLPDAGHMLIWERHPTITDLVTSFIGPVLEAAPSPEPKSG